MDGSVGELEIKYQKIAAEYSKLRAQASVLKKAVVEEQSRNIELQDVLREKEQHFRKSTHEIDSLTFRNQQLTKRVTVLQSELDATEYRSKRGKNKIPNNNSDVDSRLTMNVLDEELQKKILENAELASKIHDEDEVHKQELTVLKTYVEKLEYELEQCRKVNRPTTEKNAKPNFENFCTEKGSPNIRADRYSSNRHTQENPTFSQLSQEQLPLDKERLTKQQSSSMSENDTILTNQPREEDLSFSKIEVLPDQHLHQLLSFPLISQVANYVKDLTVAISDYHTLTEQRLHCLQTPLSPLNCKFSRHLKENSLHLQGIDLGCSELQANSKTCDQLFTPRLHMLSEKLSAYTSYLLKLLPYQQLSLDEESAALPSEDKLIAANKEVGVQVSCITDCFLKINSYVKLLSHQSEDIGEVSASSQLRFFQEIVNALTSLTGAMEDLSQAQIAKHDQERKLPTFSEKLKTTNNSTVNALSSMSNVAEKLSNTLSESLLKFEPRRKSAELLPGASCSLGSSGANLYRDVQNNLSYKTLEEQLQTCRNKAITMEQEKEHWHLEYKLLQLKHSKQMEELENQLANLPHVSAASNKENASQLPEPCTLTNLLGSLEAPLVLNAEMESREQQVKNYLTCRIDRLVAVCQGVESKAMTFSAECAVLEKRLELCTSSKVNCEGRLQEALKKVIHLQEELNTTTHNYETQLSIMSEHLANMNDKLTIQRDEIDQLKYQLSNKSSQKRKQK